MIMQTIDVQPTDQWYWKSGESVAQIRGTSVRSIGNDSPLDWQHNVRPVSNISTARARTLLDIMGYTVINQPAEPEAAKGAELDEAGVFSVNCTFAADGSPIKTRYSYTRGGVTATIEGNHLDDTSTTTMDYGSNTRKGLTTDAIRDALASIASGWNALVER
jgi:hypothetical protein